MTKEEAIKYFEKRKEKSLMLMRKAKADTPTNNKFREIVAKKIEALDMAMSALKGNEWIPVNDIEDIPKSGSYWVTKDYKFGAVVEKIRWSTVWKCWEDNDADEILTKESASLITAYMPYFEPEPYKGESEGV